MWFKSAASSSVGSTSTRRTAPSILSEGFRADGNIVCPGEIHITGTLIGNIVAGKITLGASGSVNGSVDAETAIINGALQGRLVAADVILGRSAQVQADIIYCSMRIEPGAIFEGYSRRVEREHLADAEGKQLLPAMKSLSPAQNTGAAAPAHAGE